MGQVPKLRVSAKLRQVVDLVAIDCYQRRIEIVPTDGETGFPRIMLIESHPNVNRGSKISIFNLNIDTQFQILWEALQKIATPQ